MAPNTDLESDFVLTLSDGEELSDSDTEPVTLAAVNSNLGQKRKRISEHVQEQNGKNKKQKVGLVPHTESDPHSSSDEELSQDGIIDPAFDFDLGVDEAAEDIEDFDGWGNETAIIKTSGNKKGVDIDEIISRRAKRLAHKTTGGADENSPVVVQTASGSETEDDDEMEMLDFDNDELLASDTFGGNVLADEVAEGASDAGSLDETKMPSDTDSEAESAASPTAHPDDLASDHSDAETSSQTSDEDDDAEEIAKRTAFFAPVTDVQSQPSTTTSFQQFSISRPILRALATLSFSQPTPIQSRTIPIALSGLDIVGSAVTGSGKTAAFLVPILERLLYRPRKIPTTRVVILMPTRELAVQCHQVAVALARYTDITFAQVVGGYSLREQEVILKKRPDVVIATPGRFIDHMRNSVSFTVENIEILVLDEADRMLEDGFSDELDEILKTIPKGRQTMLFSATMTESVDKLVRVGMNKPVRVSVDARKSTVSGLIQEFVRLRPGREQMRLATLAVLCTKALTERTIVFFRQKKEAHRVRIIFGLLGLKAGELHGSMSQEQRIAAVNAFRDGRTTHLLATDLASRGLDIKNVLSVVNYEAPQSHEIYLHRVGRTARAGRSGRACTIAAEPDRKVVKAAVKAARSQGAKIVSRIMTTEEVDSMHERVESYAEEVEEILHEEKEEKAMAQAETQITRGENIVKHQDEIMARPKRTWFESEKDKRAAKDRGRVELNSGSSAGTNGVAFTGEKKKLSNKDKKRLDDRRERIEGRTFKKRKGDAEAAAQPKTKSKSKSKTNMKAKSKTTSNSMTKSKSKSNTKPKGKGKR